MDHSRNQNYFATIISSALLCDSQTARKYFMLSFIGTKGKRKMHWVISVFAWYPPREWSPLVTWLGMEQSPGKTLFWVCSPTKKCSSLFLPWLILPLLGIPKPRLSMCQFLWFGEVFLIVYSSCGDRSC